jgi:hypothetical protein
MNRKPFLAAAFALLLCGCAYAPLQESASADSVLDAQYRAPAPRPPLSGDEASVIYRNYLSKVGVSAPANTRSGSADE